MARLAVEYLDGVMALLQRIRDEEMPRVAQAAELIALAIQRGGRIFAFGCTHSSLPVQDLVYRAGGLMLINPIFAPGLSSLETRPATMTSELERLSGYAKVVLDGSPIQAGDVLIVVSVSGRNAVPIEMAQLARSRQIKVIALTSIEYSGSVTSRHPSGKKMHDFADVVLDNKAGKGDALLRAEGVPNRFCPGSGVTSTALLHSLVAATIERLLEMGIEPPIFMAGNVDGGMEHNAELAKKYRDRVFYL